MLIGDGWNGAINEDYGNLTAAILTKHKIDHNSTFYATRSIGTKIQFNSGESIVFCSIHLDYKSMGTVAAQNKLVTRMEQIMAGEMITDPPGRYYNMLEVLQNDKMQKWCSQTDKVPIIIAGDFNSASHLDWTKETTDIHGGWAVEWPATKLVEEFGFTDSYRHLHPNLKTHKGYTWSTVNKCLEEWNYTIDEPQDRIDFIFHRGALQPQKSEIYEGSEPMKAMPNHWNNDYPSDHYAVITDYLM